jgi:hypothetical protein
MPSELLHKSAEDEASGADFSDTNSTSQVVEIMQEVRSFLDHFSINLAHATIFPDQDFYFYPYAGSTSTKYMFLPMN